MNEDPCAKALAKRRESEEQSLAHTIPLHNCTGEHLPKQGHQHAFVRCFEDQTSRLWCSDHTGRRATQVLFCPFCGFEAYNSEPYKEPKGKTTTPDLALTPPDKPDRVWRHYHSANRPVMSHFQFGTVHVMASDGCHAKVLNVSGAQLTVCCENLEPLPGERMLPKHRTEEEKKAERESSSAAKKALKEQELMQKYMNLGM